MFLCVCVCVSREDGKNLVCHISEHLTVLYRLINSPSLFPIISVCLEMGVFSHMRRCVGGAVCSDYIRAGATRGSF